MSLKNVKSSSGALVCTGTDGVAVSEPINKTVDLTPGLVAHYLLNNNSHDSHGTYDGVDTAMTYSGDVASFDGSSSNINSPHQLNTVSTVDDSFTISLWYKRNGTAGLGNSSSGDVHPLITSALDVASLGFMFSADMDNNKIQVQLSNNGISDRIRTTDSSSLVDLSIQDTHYLLTYDGSESSNGIKAYVDTIEYAFTWTEDGTYTGMILADLVLGAFLQNNADYYRQANGNMSNVRLYSDAKDQAFIDELFAEGYYLPDDYYIPEVVSEPQTGAEFTGVKNIVGKFEFVNLSESSNDVTAPERSIPIMTDYTLPEGEITFDYDYAGSSNVVQMFNEDLSKYTLHTELDHHVTYYNPTKFKVDSYAIGNRNSPTYTVCKAWDIYVSDNGVDFTLVHSVDGTDFASSEIREYDIGQQYETHYIRFIVRKFGAYNGQSCLGMFKPMAGELSDTDVLKTSELIKDGDKLVIIKDDDSMHEMVASGVIDNSIDNLIIDSTDPFDDGSLLVKYKLDGNLSDLLGGALCTGTINAYEDGVFGQAVKFNKDTTSLYPPISMNAAYTVSLFMRLDSFSDDVNIVDSRKFSGSQYIYSIPTSKRLYASGAFSNITLNGKIQSDDTSWDLLETGKDYHITFQLNESKKIELGLTQPSLE